MEGNRGFRGKGGRGGRRPWRGRPRSHSRSTDNLTASGAPQEQTEDGGNQGFHSIPIYDSSEFEDNNSGSRGRGNRRRPYNRGRGSGERGHPSQRRPRSASIQDRGDRQGNGRGNYRGQRSSSSYRNEGHMRYMGYKRLEELYKEDDPDAVLLQLVTGRNGFEKLLDTQMESDWMFFLVAILVKAYESTKDQNRNELTKILSSKQLILIHLLPFLDKLEFDIISFTDDQKIGEFLWNLCRLTLCLFQNMQSSIPLLAPFLDKLENLANDKYKSICISYCPKIYTELKDLQEAKTEIHKNYIKNLQKEERPKRRPEPENTEPPDDFHDLSVLPTLQDLQFNQKPFLRVNRTKGGYNNLQQYLDIQFRLLREDYLHPLREGILDYRRELEEAKRVGRKRQTDIRMYENVEILRPLCSKQGVRHVIRFDNTKLATIRWESSRRLLYGSLLCLSLDDFQTMLFATVTERKVTDLQNGIVEVQFTEDAHSFNLSANQLYAMAETTAYFEAYRYILQGLQEVGNDMPLQSSIVHCKPNEKPPRYLIKAGSVMPYDFCPLLQMDRKPKEFLCPVLNTRKWPSAKQLGMDDSQHKALQMAITKEIAIIQGPPGTGKTYVGLKIVQLLMHNKEMWTENTKMDPILVVCYTNHALDQFLVGISKYSEKLVRIGGRCKTEELEEYSLQNYRMKAREDKSISRTIHERKSECRMNMANCSDKIELVSEKLKCAKQGILRLNELSQFMDDVHVNSFENDSESKSQRANIDEWLGFDVNMMENSHESDEDKHKNMLMMEWENELTNGSKVERMKRDEANLVKNPWQLKLYERGALYKCLLKEFQDFIGNRITLLKNDATRTRKAKSSKKPKAEEEINSCLNLLTKSGKYIVEVKYLIEFMPNYFKRIPKMIQEEGGIIDWLCLDGSPENCNRIAEVLLEEFLDAKEEAEYENEERKLEEEDIEDDDELNFFSGYSQGKEKDETSSKNLSDASFAILHGKVDRAENTNGWAVQISRSKLRKNLKKIIDSNDIMSPPEVTRVKNIWKLKPLERQRLYRYWLSCYITYMKGSIQEAEKQYDDLCKGYREVLDAEDVEIMRGADVIGMTTTGAAKYRNILQSIRPKIIIVEEAAEVLESHIVTTINSNCQHLILIGDHKQLRPTPTVYFLAKKYNLDLSLFERMVNNDMNYVTLGIQHRMRPEISILMKYENLYPDLNDHEDVKVYEHVKGVTSDVYFLNHSEPETDHRETKSKSNIHEAKFVKRLCRYFLQQDYQRSQITILTAYTGQILALKKEMPKNEFEGVRITSIDNFQGEENDIIILSLVRSNSMGSSGFLKIDNRICVALSRARKGLYVIGNFELLCSESELWRYVVNVMKDRNSFGKSLILQCGNHPGNSAEVSRDSDFDQVSNGGCYLPCNFILECSHKCGQICHVSDPKHELYKCLQPCLKKCDKGHFCQRKCFQDCEGCKVKVKKIIPSCGHVENVPCSVNEDQWCCKAACNIILPCKHVCKGTCGNCKKQNVHEQCLEPCKKRLLCGHIIDAKCSDEEKNLICKTPCNGKLECGHLCTGTCNDCQQGRLHIPCQSKSDGKRLSCGHIIDAICSADEENLVCMKPCGGKLECGHICSGICHDCQQGRLHIPCQSKCDRKLICGHRCLALCVKGCPPCDQNCQTSCEHRKCKTKCSDPCEDCKNPCSRRCIHQACEKSCSEKCVKLPCSQNCDKTRSCGHACLGICGENCPQMCTDCHLITFQDSSCEIDKGVRLVTLNDCIHTFSVDSLDRYMFNRSSSYALTLPQCPICFAHIKKSVRYKHVVEEIRNDMEVIKKKINEESTSSLKSKLKYVQEKVTMLKARDPEAVSFIIKQLNEDKAKIIERVEFAHAQVIILEIIYNIYQSILLSVIEDTKEEKQIGLQLTRIRQWLFKCHRIITKKKTKTVQLQTRYCFSRQELSDVRLELLRLAYLVQFLKFNTESSRIKCTTEVQELFKKSPFLETKCKRIRSSARVYGIGLDEGLFNDLVSPDVLQHYRIWQYGTWFKCRSGKLG